MTMVEPTATIAPARTVGKTPHGDIVIHYDPRELYPDHQPAINSEYGERGEVVNGTSRRVLVTIGGDFAGSITYSTEEEGGYGMCCGQRDQIVGVFSRDEDESARCLADYYRPGDGY